MVKCLKPMSLEPKFDALSGPPAFNDSLHVFESPQFKSVVEDAVAFFDSTPVHPLPPTDRFIGPGVYGLYYTGDFEPYLAIADANRNEMVKPIYVGKAVSPGWRQAAPVTLLRQTFTIELDSMQQAFASLQTWTSATSVADL